MPKAIVVLVTVALFFSCAAYAETDTKSNDRTHHLGVLVGSGIASYREDLIVPISFDGPAFFLGTQYTARTARSSLHLRLRVSAALLENRYLHKAHAAAVELRPSWVKLLRGDVHGSQVWCGIALPLHMTNLLVDSWDDSHLYWLTAYSLALVGEYRSSSLRLGRLAVRLELPIVGLVSRPPAYRHHKQEALTHWTYHISGPNKSFKFEGLWEFQSPMFQVMLERGSHGPRLNFGLEFELEHSSEPRDIWGLNTRLVFAYQWRIG